MGSTEQTTPMDTSLMRALPKSQGEIITLEGADEVRAHPSQLSHCCTRTVRSLLENATQVPDFDAALVCATTIAPPLDANTGRGKYASMVCAQMASKKSLRAREYATKEKGITVVIAGRISYALNAAQEWRESFEAATARDAAPEALDEELSESDRRAADDFGPEAEARARVWCYKTHEKRQLEALFYAGDGVCIISPKFCMTFLQWINELSPTAQIDRLYVEEVMGLAQMWNTKVLRSVPCMEAMRTLATKRSRRVFGFCADYLLDDRPSILMGYLVGDLPLRIFKVPNTRKHMERSVCLFHDTVPEECKAFDELYSQLLACAMKNPDFRIWHSISYETECIKRYTDACQLGIRSKLLIGNMDEEDKLRILTNFDDECRDVQALFATSVVRDGVNSKLKWSAVVNITGPQASGPITHGQGAGRAGRVDGLEYNTILWKLLNTPRPKDGEQLTPVSAAEKIHRDTMEEKDRHAQRHRLKSRSTPKALVDLAVRNEKERMDVRSHCALATRRVVEYKGWHLVDHTSISLSPRVKDMTPELVAKTLADGRPLHDSLIQKIDSMSDEAKMKIGLDELLSNAQSKYESGQFESYVEAMREVLETCDGTFAHSHVNGTYQSNKKIDAKERQKIRAWKAARHFGDLTLWKPKELLVIEKFEDALNLAACHLTLGVRGLLLAQTLLCNRSADVGLYTHLPERVGALEEACKIIGVPNLSAPQIKLTAGSHPFVRLLQADAMGAPSIDVNDALKGLRKQLHVAIAPDRTATSGSKTLMDVLRSLLGCICAEVKVTQDRRMTAQEASEWEKRAGVSELAQKAQVQGQVTSNDLDALYDDEDSDEAMTAPEQEGGPAPPKPQASTKRKAANLRLPTEVEIRRKPFYFLPDGTPVTEKKAGDDARLVDFVPKWRVFSHTHGVSKPVHDLLGKMPSEAAVDRELESLLPGPRLEQVEITPQEREWHTAEKAKAVEPPNAIVSRLTPRMKDGEVVVEEPVPAEPLRRALKRLRRKKRAADNRVCTPELLKKYKDASKAQKQRIEREYERNVREGMGPADTAALQWLEAMDAKAEKNPDKYGLRWNLVKYRVKFGVGREVASWPSIQSCPNKKPDRLRQELFSSIMHDWDIVSAHFFLSEAVIRGQLKRDPKTCIPTICKYNRACEEDLRTGRGKEHNTFLKDIAEWYGVTVDEAKMGCHILHNQGTVETWLTKELNPPREVPDSHPDDVIALMREAVTLRTLFIQHAESMLGSDAFNALKESLRRERPDDHTLKHQAGMERSIFGYCMQHHEKTATDIMMKVSTDHGMPPITRMYDGFGQWHVDGKDPAAFKQAAEEALRAHFGSPIYLLEKPFYKSVDEEGEEVGDDGDGEDGEDGAGEEGEDGDGEEGDEGDGYEGEEGKEGDEEEDEEGKEEGHGEEGEDGNGEEGDEEDGEDGDGDHEEGDGEDDSDESDDSMEDSLESDNGDGLPDNGAVIDPDEPRSEDEEPDSDDDSFISTSDSDESSEEGEEGDGDLSEEDMSVEEDNPIGRKRARELLASDDDE